MFGDLFNQKDDYLSGTHYGGRRTYLVSAGKNALEPPSEFKTKRQSQRSLAQQREQTMNTTSPTGLAKSKPVRKMSTLNAANLVYQRSAFIQKRKIISKPAKAVYSAIVLDHYSSVNRADWEEEEQAGCHMWVNRKTGEVSEECPWKPRRKLFPLPSDKAKDNQPSDYEIRKKQADEDSELGTGALVYESTELDNLLQLLDSNK